MKKNFSEFGQKLKSLRIKKGSSITMVAKVIGINRTHLSKLENGHERPSMQVLNNLINHFSLLREEALELANLAGYTGQGMIVTEPELKREGVNPMKNNSDSVQSTRAVQVTIKDNTPVLYTDSIFISKNHFGMILDFAQSMGPTNKQIVVARVGLSIEHAKALLGVLTKKLTKFEPKDASDTIKN